MDHKGDYNHVKALVSSIHGTFPNTVFLENSFPTSTARSTAPMTETEERFNRPDATSSTNDPNTESGSLSPSKMPHLLGIPSLVIPSTNSPFHLSSNTPGTGDGEHHARRFSFALIRRHSNMVPKSQEKSHSNLE